MLKAVIIYWCMFH